MNYPQKEISFADIRAFQYTWESFQSKMDQFKLHCRFGEFEEAEVARLEAFAFLEANFDVYAAAFR